MDTVYLNEKNNALVIIDQTLLPNEMKTIEICTAEEIYDAIKKLKVRGAPAIGVAAAIGLYVCAERSALNTLDEFEKEFYSTADYLVSSRPTAVNLSWAVERMKNRFREIKVSAYKKTEMAKEELKIPGKTDNRKATKEKNVQRFPKDQVGEKSTKYKNDEEIIRQIKEGLKAEALSVYEQDIEVCRNIGENGLAFIKDGCGILTHCNAGSLATVRYGTATAPMYLAHEKGLGIKVYCDETRPLLQGARLTAFELVQAGIDTTLLCDNMSASLMKSGAVDVVFVGCDRVAANGDVANKIGTSMVAVMAKKYNIPFYVCAPTSTIDMNTPTGDDIEIEQRQPEEVTDMWYKNTMAPKSVSVYNPAFDVTEAEYITGIITEYGVIKAPYEENLKKLWKERI